jgi:hypothetical protein
MQLKEFALMKSESLSCHSQSWENKDALRQKKTIALPAD